MTYMIILRQSKDITDIQSFTFKMLKKNDAKSEHTECFYLFFLRSSCCVKLLKNCNKKYQPKNCCNNLINLKMGMAI